MGKNGPRHLSWSAFMTHFVGLPLTGSPLVFLCPPSLRQTTISCPHPLEKGRGSWGCILACEGAVALVGEPTSPNRGEGVAVELWGVVAGDLWWGGPRWWWKDKRERSKINRDGVDGELKLRSPSQITFDMSTRKSNSKIKNCILL